MAEKQKRITISPITRLEGHGKIEIFLNDDGNVDDAFFQVVELRGFEEFCKGRPIEEMPRLTTRLCGVCPWAHHIASTKCLDNVFHVKPTETARKLRELGYAAHMAHSHLIHIYALGAAPDLLIGPTAPPEKRNVVGVLEAAGKLDPSYPGVVINGRAAAQRIQDIIGGKTIHPVTGLPGGLSKGITEEQRKEIEELSKVLVDFAKFTEQLVVDEVVLKNKDYVDLITSDTYMLNTYYMGLVDDNNNVTFYDGTVRVVDPNGKEFVRFGEDNNQYLDHITEHVEPWSYLKFPYLKNVGWKGLVAGEDSGIYRVAPLARLNAADGMATPIAQEQYKKMYEAFGGKPVHNTLAMHWARIIENTYASELCLKLAEDESITDSNVRNIPTEKPTEGVGIVEAPRGTLFHHYVADENGLVKEANLIVATGNNNAAMCMDVKGSAQKLIKNWEVNEGLLNMVEMAFRAYDPCLACATHTLPGQTPLEVNIYDSKKRLYKRLSQNI